MAGSHDYLKLPNQGNIASNLRLLYEIQLASDYADANGYYTKRDIAEIAANSLIITTGSLVGNDVAQTLDNGEIAEEMNSALQNTKMRMQLLRILGLVSTDYDSEIYAITPLGELMCRDIPKASLVRELFMGICSTTEIYKHNCAPDFFCYLGLQICLALASLDYKLTTEEMSVITTYDYREINDFIEDARRFREAKTTFKEQDHPHYPRTQRGQIIKQASNLTRTINQILRYCGIIKDRQKKIDGVNYYICTPEGQDYVDEIQKGFRRNIRLVSTYEFRQAKIFQQQTLCKEGYENLLRRADIQFDTEDNGVYFSPYQLIPETAVFWLTGRTPRKSPTQKDSVAQAINSQLTIHDLRLSAIYNEAGEFSYDENSPEAILIAEIEAAKEAGKNQDEFITELCELHRDDDKFRFYPFCHSLLNIIGLDCSGEIGRYDAFAKFQNHIIPAEIKSYTETHSYNLKGLRQAIENKIMSYNKDLENDLSFASWVIGFEHPSNDFNLVKTFIDEAKEKLNIKIIATDIRSLVKMAVKVVWDNQSIDLDKLLKGYGIISE